MTTLYHPRPERWPQFSLRGIFVLTTLLGTLCWLGVQLKWIRDRHELLHALSGGDGSVRMSNPDPIDPLPPPPFTKAPWSLRIFGEPAVSQIRLWPDGKHLMGNAQALFPEAQVELVEYFQHPFAETPNGPIPAIDEGRLEP